MQKAKATVERSKSDIPEGFEMPVNFEQAPPPRPRTMMISGPRSDEELDFGGSDTGDDDGDDQEMQDFDEEGDEDQEIHRSWETRRGRKRLQEHQPWDDLENGIR